MNPACPTALYANKRFSLLWLKAPQAPQKIDTSPTTQSKPRGRANWANTEKIPNLGRELNTNNVIQELPS